MSQQQESTPTPSGQSPAVTPVPSYMDGVVQTAKSQDESTARAINAQAKAVEARQHAIAREARDQSQAPIPGPLKDAKNGKD